MVVAVVHDVSDIGNSDQFTKISAYRSAPLLGSFVDVSHARRLVRTQLIVLDPNKGADSIAAEMYRKEFFAHLAERR